MEVHKKKVGTGETAWPDCMSEAMLTWQRSEGSIQRVERCAGLSGN